MRTIHPTFFVILLLVATASLIAQTNTFPLSGNVGIGTTSPGVKLQVEGTGMFVSPNSGTSGGVVIRDASGNPGNPILQFVNNAASVQYSYLQGLSSGGLALMGGNVGIGILNPSAALDVNGEITARASGGGQAFRAIGRSSDNFTWAPLAFASDGTTYTGGMYYTPTAVALCAGSGLTSVMTWLPGGNVGIGTVSPGGQLGIVMPVGNAGLTITDSGTNNQLNRGVITTHVARTTQLALTRAAVATWGFDITTGGTAVMTAQDIGANILAMQLTGGSAGNVGIGTTNPTQKLSVNGTIQAKEVIVQTGWSDYVFKPGYKLASLSEVEGAIKRDGHLPGIPSAQEVAEHGVSMGEMQSKLLAKIEELTLHQIALEKENHALRERVTALEQR